MFYFLITLSRSSEIVFNRSILIEKTANKDGLVPSKPPSWPNRRGAASNEILNHGRDAREANEKVGNAEFIDILKRAFVSHNKHVAVYLTRPSIRRHHPRQTIARRRINLYRQIVADIYLICTQQCQLVSNTTKFIIILRTQSIYNY